MDILIIGGTGFIGRRLVHLLHARGHVVTVMDTEPAPTSFADLGERVRTIRGDVGSFTDVMAAMGDARPDRVVNLAYLIGSRHPPRAALHVNVLGMGHCFEAARILGVPHVVYAGSFAANGRQSHHGDRAVTEDDPVHPDDQYSRHKVMNEWQALDYIETHGMRITGIRTSYLTGADKVRGSTHHVRCITEPALGRAVTLPFRDMMQCLMHVDDAAQVFASVVLAEAPRHRIYNCGGLTVSLGELAAAVQRVLPGASIGFEHETGARAANSSFLIDNTRLAREFGVPARSLDGLVRQIIQETQAAAGLPGRPHRR
ncbi:MAG: NAD(P)-dependent oxidoreductase [Acetobacteraceae bacterium]|nr:NAD(P)-dependent oxidoreductase [Acetobacteraceae bacterium]